MPKQQLPQYVKTVLLKRFKENEALSENEQAIIDCDILGNDTQIDPAAVINFIANNTTWDSLNELTALFKSLLPKIYPTDVDAEKLIQALENPDNLSRNLCACFILLMTRNSVRGINLMNKTAAQNFAPAQYTLGFMFQIGVGVKQDDPIALELFTKAAEQNFVPAVRILAKLRQEQNLQQQAQPSNNAEPSQSQIPNAMIPPSPFAEPRDQSHPPQASAQPQNSQSLEFHSYIPPQNPTPQRQASTTSTSTTSATCKRPHSIVDRSTQAFMRATKIRKIVESQTAATTIRITPNERKIIGELPELSRNPALLQQKSAQELSQVKEALRELKLYVSKNPSSESLQLFAASLQSLEDRVRRESYQRSILTQQSQSYFQQIQHRAVAPIQPNTSSSVPSQENTQLKKTNEVLQAEVAQLKETIKQQQRQIGQLTTTVATLAANMNPAQAPVTTGTAVIPQRLFTPPCTPEVTIMGTGPSQRTALDTLGTAATVVKQEPKSPTRK